MGPDPVYNPVVCRLAWSRGETSKYSQANVFVQCIFHITGVSLPSQVYREDPGKPTEWSSSRNGCRQMDGERKDQVLC